MPTFHSISHNLPKTLEEGESLLKQDTFRNNTNEARKMLMCKEHNTYLQQLQRPSLKTPLKNFKTKHVTPKITHHCAVPNRSY